MGPRLLYTHLVGAVIFACLASRVWDPSPVARLLVFDASQRAAPLKFDPPLPVRIVDIDEDSLKKIGHWPWPHPSSTAANGQVSSIASWRITVSLRGAG